MRRLPSWTVLPWDSAYLDARDYQWNEVALPFWRDIQARAAAADVKVCIEMHPHNLVYNPATMERLATEIGATHVGAEMDPSHLFWQGIDPVARRPLPRRPGLQRRRQGHPHQRGGQGQRRAGRPVRAGRPRRARCHLPRRSLHAEPLAAAVSWDFVAVGRGHDVGWWTEFLQALGKVDPEMAVNIEHEDQELDQMEGLRSAAQTLLQAAAQV